ncbi:hypothetical protein GPJ56_005879 [Histomonas meleagridis]|uniref:uncharacterized protein n=1 Tax=Histomonas meleagridis TaxID=135588 RepID=UPI00355947BD|nr:hypothetical protein GPJ56_005879 [Histomonas meleagridis]KAH0798586.1 hypothetical protein GO595_008451 [Histomonas meleagridis]
MISVMASVIFAGTKLSLFRIAKATTNLVQITQIGDISYHMSSHNSSGWIHTHMQNLASLGSTLRFSLRLALRRLAPRCVGSLLRRYHMIPLSEDVCTRFICYYLLLITIRRCRN